MALHSSFLGTAVSIWIFSSLPFYAFCSFPDGRIYNILCKAEGRKNHIFLFLTAACFILQLFCHYVMQFEWIPLRQFPQG